MSFENMRTHFHKNLSTVNTAMKKSEAFFLYEHPVVGLPASRFHKQPSSNTCKFSGHGTLNKWDGGRAPRGRIPITGQGSCPSPVMGIEVSPQKMFKNIGANLCNLVHFWRPVQ